MVRPVQPKQKAVPSKKQQSSTINNSNSNENILNIPIVNHSKHQLPIYQNEGASGLDFQANIESKLIIQPSDRVTIPTGIFIQIPQGFEAQIRSRSGLAENYEITVANSPGTIDADYRGEIKVILINKSENEFAINDGDRIAQTMFTNVTRIKWKTVPSLQQTERSNQGFGSTGVHKQDENRRAQTTPIDRRLIIDDSHQPSYQDFVLISNKYCPNQSDSATSDKEKKKNGFKISKMEVKFEGNDFTPFELGKNSLVEAAINEIGPLLVEETDLLTLISPVVQNQSNFARKPV